MSGPLPRDQSRLYEALARDAKALRGDQVTPVDLNAVAARLGINLEWGSRRLDSVEGALFHHRRGWTAAVADPDPRRPRTRFTMAHEIGHLMLERYGVSRPSTQGEYWRTEALCHYFAGRLLIPDLGVDWVAAAGERGPSELLRRSSLLSRRALVSPQALSHRLSQDLDYLAFCEVRFDSPRRGVIAVVDWMVERFSWLGVRARNYIESDHYLARSLARLRGSTPDHLTAGFLNGLPVAALRRPNSVWLLGLEPALARVAPAESSQLPLPGTCAARPAPAMAGAPSSLVAPVGAKQSSPGEACSHLPLPPREQLAAL